MKMRYGRYDEGGRGPGDEENENDDSVMENVMNYISGLNSPLGDALMGIFDKLNNARDRKEALDEFNRIADQMPSGSDGPVGPDRRDMPPMRMLDPKGIAPIKGGSGYDQRMSMFAPPADDRKLKRMSDQPIVGDDVKNRKMLFDKLRRRRP